MLGMVVADALYRRFPELPEGRMTSCGRSSFARRACTRLRRSWAWANTSGSAGAREHTGGRRARPFWRMLSRRSSRRCTWTAGWKLRVILSSGRYLVAGRGRPGHAP